jgi:hypothetical protein
LVFLFVQYILNPSGKTNKMIEGSVQKFSFIYSHPFEKYSYLISTNDGVDFVENKLEVSDIFNMQKSEVDEKSLLLFPTHEKKLYQFSNKGGFEQKKESDPLTFYLQDRSLTIKSLNSEVNKNTLDVIDHDFSKDYSLDFSSFVVKAIYNNDYIFVVSNKITDIKSMLHIINRRDGAVIKTITFESPSYDVFLDSNDVYVTNEDSISVVSLGDYSKNEYSYPAENAMADKIYVVNDRIFISYGNLMNGSANLLVLNKNMKLLKDLNLDIPYSGAKFIDDDFYVLSQFEVDDEEDSGGKLTQVDLNDLKIESSIELPKKDLKVQDFFVID